MRDNEPLKTTEYAGHLFTDRCDCEDYREESCCGHILDAIRFLGNSTPPYYLHEIKHVGLHAGRDNPNNPREQAFAEMWRQENDITKTMPTLLALLKTGQSRPFSCNPSDSREQAWALTQRDATIAATIIQWLGSNIGHSFLEMALGHAGFNIVRRNKL